MVSIGTDRYGIDCPECGEVLSSVIDTREAFGRIRRRRECPNGHRVTTAEVLSADIDEVMEALSSAHEALERITAAVRRLPLVDRRMATKARDAA